MVNTIILMRQQIRTMKRSPRVQLPFHLMAKPAGPVCNLDCKYCYYLEKARLFPEQRTLRMSDQVLEAYIRGTIEAQAGATVSFAWQGGEPTLAGLPFFKRVVRLQTRYAMGKCIENSFQTNGTGLSAEWCRFLRDENFLVGISIDGPERLHDAYRVDRRGAPTYRQVMRGIELCQQHGVAFNTLTVVHALNVEDPLTVYRFLQSIGSTYLQFIPLVERCADAASEALGLGLAHPPEGAVQGAAPDVTEWSVPAAKLGDFWCRIFDSWVSRDVGRCYVQLFDTTLGKWLGLPGGVCTQSESCGRTLVVEREGDVYACDHYVYPRYRIGNVLDNSIASMIESQMLQEFGARKQSRLTRQCRNCTVRFVCNGDCPKHRFLWSRDGEYGHSYLCTAYDRFFRHSAPAMRTMAKLYRQGEPPAKIMDFFGGR